MSEFIDRVPLYAIEDAYPGSTSLDLDHGAFSKRFVLAIGRAAEIGDSVSGGSFNKMMRFYEDTPPFSDATGVRRTDRYPGADHKLNGMPQPAVTVDSFLSLMYGITAGNIKNNFTPGKYKFMLLAGNSIISLEEPPLLP